MDNRLLLAAGVAGPAVFVRAVVLGGLLHPDYSHIANAVSELSQSGSPTALRVSLGFAASAMLCAAFGIGVVRAAKGNRMLRLTGWLLLAYAALALPAGTIFPMDPFGSKMTFPGLMHIVTVAGSALALFAMIPAGAVALRHETQWFPAYSWATVAAMLAGGAISGIAGFYGVPILGAAERLTQGAYLLWIAVLAVLLLTRSARPANGRA